jgi:hypothetical protein
VNLGKAAEMGYVCGLNTLDEAVDNVYMHATQLFYWPHIELELRSLYEDYAEHGNGLVVDFLGAARCNEIDVEVEVACGAP